MSTLRVSNIEAKADVSSPSVHEKIKVTNSEGDVLVHIDGATSGISTVGINTTVKTFDVDSNQNIDFVGNLTAPNITVTGTLSYDDVTNIDSVGVITARSNIHVTGGSIGIGTVSPSGPIHAHTASGTQRSYLEASAAHSFLRLKSGSTSYNSGVEFFSGASNIANINGLGAGGLQFEVNGSERLRITSDGKLLIGSDTGSVHGNRLLQVGKTDRSETYVSIVSNTSGESGLLFADTTTNDTGGYRGQIRYHHSDDSMNFRTGAAERLRITSDGQIGMGIASPTQESGTGLHIRGANGGQTRIHLTNSDTGDTATDGFYIVSQGAESGGASGEVMLQQKENKALKFATNNTERLRITSDGTLESYSTNDTTPNIRWRSDDTNWFGALNQSVEGGTITSFLSCGGDWTANGTTYSATKALAAYPTSAIAVHNQYNSTWGSDFVFLSKAGGSSTTDGAVSERLRINSEAELVQTSPPNSTNSWYSLNSNNTVIVTNGDNDIYIERVGGSNGYDQLVYKKTPMTDNCDISFRLSGSQPGGTWRHIGITICGDGGSDFADMDRLVIRQQGATGGSLNKIRVDKAGGGSTADVQSGSIPSFFDGTERNVLIQIRGNIIHILSDNVLVFSEQMNAALHSITGFFGIGIYETTGNIRLRNFQLTNYGALGVPQKRPCLQTNMSYAYGSHGSLTTTVASSGILQASAYIDLCGNYTTSGSNAYTFVCPVDGVYAVNAHISMGGGAYARHIWVMSYTMGGGNLPLATYTEVLDLHPDAHSNHSYYNLWKFTKGTRIGMGINGNSGTLSGRSFQWGIMLVS